MNEMIEREREKKYLPENCRVIWKTEE